MLLGQRELPAEHPLVKLEQQRLLTGKGPEKRAWRHARGAGDLRGRRALISLFQKQLYGGVQNLFNAYQKDFDKGVDRDSGYIYGPSLPRSWFIGAKVSF